MTDTPMNVWQRINLADRIVSASASSAVTEGARRAQYSAMKEAEIGWRFDLPNEGQIREVLDGVGAYDKVKLFSKQEMQGVRTTVTQGMLSGRSYDDIGRLVAQQTDKEVYKARRLVRTTMAQAATDSKTRTYQDLGIEEYEIVCVLDERTCPICAKYDGKVYRTGKGPHPTFHPNCRCTMRQVMPDKMRERMRRSARDAQGNTIQIPASMTYADWAKQYGSESAQRKLGDMMLEQARETTPQEKASVIRQAHERAEADRNLDPSIRLHPEKVAETPKGESMSFYKADGGRTNPNLLRDRSYRLNCQSCVVANEMRRRGYDVEALGADGNAVMETLSEQTNLAWIDPETNEPPEYIRCQGRTSSELAGWLGKTLVQGARYTMEWDWKDDFDLGHIANIELTDLGLRLHDPQLGTTVYEDDIEDYFDRIVLDDPNRCPSLLRIDDKYPNLDIVDRILKEVEKDGEE